MKFEGKIIINHNTELQVALLDKEYLIREISVKRILKQIENKIELKEYNKKKYYNVDDFITLCIENVEKSKDIKDTVKIFGYFGAKPIIEEVTGYSMHQKIKDKLSQKEALSDFDKKIKTALEFNPKENK